MHQTIEKACQRKETSLIQAIDIISDIPCITFYDHKT